MSYLKGIEEMLEPLEPLESKTIPVAFDDHAVFRALVSKLEGSYMVSKLTDNYLVVTRRPSTDIKAASRPRKRSFKDFIHGQLELVKPGESAELDIQGKPASMVYSYMLPGYVMSVQQGVPMVINTGSPDRQARLFEAIDNEYTGYLEVQVDTRKMLKSYEASRGVAVDMDDSGRYITLDAIERAGKRAAGEETWGSMKQSLEIQRLCIANETLKASPVGGLIRITRRG